MLSILARSLYPKQNYFYTAKHHINRCGLLKPLAPYLQGITYYSDPCGGGNSPGGAGGSRHKVTFKTYQAPVPMQHDYKNMALGRPMSPHLTIYAPTVPAMTSIFQRITGIILTFYAVLLSAGSLFLSNGVETYVSMIQSLDLNRLLIFLIKIMLGAPFAFHYFNGIRFCMWNLTKWFTMKEVSETAKKCFVLTAVLTVFFAIL